MKYIRNYKVFENNTNLTQEQKDFLDECTNGTWEVNPDTGLIDVQGSFDCNNMELNDFKGLRFGNVSKYFFCNHNNLENLDGSPRKVGESFWCLGNPLISLKGAPLEAGGLVFNNFQNRYNLATFIEKIKEDSPGVTKLLLTHHFLTPEVIKHNLEKDEDDKFCIAVGRAWNTEGFRNKRTILENPNDPDGLSPEILQKIKDFSAIRGYL